jgi:hypothetical protein
LRAEEEVGGFLRANRRRLTKGSEKKNQGRSGFSRRREEGDEGERERERERKG